MRILLKLYHQFNWRIKGVIGIVEHSQLIVTSAVMTKIKLVYHGADFTHRVTCRFLLSPVFFLLFNYFSNNSLVVKLNRNKINTLQ
jgi:hypothetical protein